METAKLYLKHHPECEQLFFNENMDWHFVVQGDYQNPISRAEIMEETPVEIMEEIKQKRAKAKK